MGNEAEQENCDEEIYQESNGTHNEDGDRDIAMDGFDEDELYPH